MTSPIFAPQPPVPASWAPAGGWYGAGQRSQNPASSNAPVAPGTPGARLIWTPSGPAYFAGDTPQSDIDAYIQKGDAYNQHLEDAMAASSGIEREKLAAQTQDSKDKLNQLKQAAQLVAQTSRYGTDAQRKTAQEDLAEKVREFDANHGIELQKLGLEYANTATQYLSTPDRYIQAGNYINMAGNALGRTPQQYGAASVGSPVAKNQSDFAVLAGYPNPAGAGANAPMSGGTGASATPSATGTPTTNTTNTPQVQQDPRVNAVLGMIKALPPSQDLGLNGNDYAVLQAAHALYSSGKDLGPGTVARMSPDNLAINRSAGARLGYSPKDWEFQMNFADPGNRASNLA